MTYHVVDIQLWASDTVASSLFPHDVKLHFLSLVDVSRIPIYLAAGPSLDVSTDNETTARWLTEALLERKEYEGLNDACPSTWRSSRGRQLDQGVLLRVGDGRGLGGNVTELLIYAGLKTDTVFLPTPPASSSSVPPDEPLPETVPEVPEQFKIYALPLCSNVFGHAEEAAGLVSPPLEDCPISREACFLPYPLDQPRKEQKTHQKRQSLSSLFDDATQKRRRFKGRGGESISKAMAGIDRPSLQQGLPSYFDHEELETPSLPQKAPTARNGLKRASTTMSLPSSEYHRPASRSGPIASGKRSSLHRVESAICPRDSPTLSDVDGSLVEQNKAALTKVVMAGMRLYGLQQRKKLCKGLALEERPKTATSVNDSRLFNEDEDEYKLVYHQTFKAAAFVFRRHFNMRAISQDLMRDVVDRFLTLFCSDPMAGTGLQDGDPRALGLSSGNSVLAFDKPTATASSPMLGNVLSPPTAKKR